MNYRALREECCEANLKLPATGLVDLTFGNVSVYDPTIGIFAIKPSGVDYDELTPGMMVLLDMEGNIVEGDLRPSSDTPTHRCLYRAFGAQGVHAVVHTHSRHAVAFAQAGREIPCLGTTHADYFYGSVPVTDALTTESIESSYEWETGRIIVAAFVDRNPLDVPAVLVRHHGPFAWGPNAPKAVETAFALEVIAQMARDSLLLNPHATAIPDALLDKHFLRKHGATAYYGQD